jgi:hypothetical protein
VNFTSRILSVAGDLGAKVVCSNDFSQLVQTDGSTSHKVPLRGFAQPQDVIVMRC